VLGVFSEDVIDVVAATLAELGIERAFVVHGEAGWMRFRLQGKRWSPRSEVAWSAGSQ